MDLKNFITEEKVEEERKRRQAEWERVRKPNDPIEAPSDVFDNRTLYDKLKEQHEMKKKTFEDQFALKNQIRGIDTDEAQFLDEIDQIKSKTEKIKKLEEKKEIEEYKAVEEKKTESVVPKIHISVQKKDKNQTELLSKVVISKRKKSNDEDPNENKRCKGASVSNKPQQIIAILPGVGEYNSNSSSSSEYSSDDEIIHKPTEHAKETVSLFSNHAASTESSAANEVGKSH